MATLHPKPQIFTDLPATQALAVTPSDADDLWCRGIWVGAAGNVAIVPFDGGSAVTLVGVPAGTWLPIACQRVNSTNTTAGSIVALW